jgi:hypothetical protein
MTFDVSLQYRIIISETHFPVVNNVVIDSIDFSLVRMNIEGLDTILHENWIFIESVFDIRFFSFPQLLVLFVLLYISCLLCIFDLLFLLKTIEQCSPLNCCVKSILAGASLVEWMILRQRWLFQFLGFHRLPVFCEKFLPELLRANYIIGLLDGTVDDGSLFNCFWILEHIVSDG